MDKIQLARFHKIIEDNVSNPFFSNDNLAELLNLSLRQTHRQVKAETGLPPLKYMRKYRLERAMSLMRNGNCRSVKAAARSVGFINVGYFIRLFKKRYGKSPLQILREEGWRN